DSPAARAGLKSGDIIMEFNGKKVDDPSALARAVALAKPGETSRLALWRDRQQKAVEIKLGEIPAERTAAVKDGSGTDASGLGGPEAGAARRQGAPPRDGHPSGLVRRDGRGAARGRRVVGVAPPASVGRRLRPPTRACVAVARTPGRPRPAPRPSLLTTTAP